MNVVPYMVVCLLFAVSAVHAQKQRVHKLNDAVKERVAYKTASGEVRHGKYTQLYSGRRTVTGRYRNGKKHGRWRRIDQNDNTWVELHYRDGQKHGDFIYYDEEQNVLARGQFQNGLPAGKWTAYHQSGTVRTVKKHGDNGIPVQTIHYYPEGEIARNIEVKVKGGDTLSTISDYYKNTRIARYAKRKNGKQHGKQILYYENGVKREELIYKDGKLADAVIARTESGKPIDQGDFSNGTGTLKRYHPAGSVYSVREYVHGVPHGTVEKYHSGKLRERGQYRRGKPAGVWERYTETFRKDLELNFEGDTVRYKKIYSSGGTERTEGFLTNGKKTNAEVTYNSYNNTELKIQYRDGLRHGRYEQYFRNNPAARVSGEYRHGVRVGEWFFYNELKEVTYHEVRENNPLFLSDPFKTPEGYVAYSEPGVEELLNENIYERYADFYDAGYFLPDHPGMNLLERGFHFYDQERDYDRSYRDTEIPHSGRFEKPFFTGNEEMYLNAFKLLRHPADHPPEGSVIYRIKLNELGLIDSTELVRSAHPDLDAAGYSLLNDMPAFSPGILNGFPVPVYVLKVVVYERERE